MCERQPAEIWGNKTGRSLPLPLAAPSVRYHVCMRASEAHRRHNEETDRLIGTLRQKDREFAEIAAAEPGGPAAMKDHAVLVTRSEALLAAGETVSAARRALDEHVQKSTHFVRNYRILDLKDGSEIDHFTIDYELAPWHASKRMGAKQISQYNLQEQLPDGTWVPYYPPRDE